MKNQVNKIDVAVNQLDWAIKLFLDHQAFVPAITLAGAAEEIVGQAVASDSAFQALKKNLSEKSGLPEKLVSQDLLNKVKNWFKHWGEMRDEESIEIDLETEAIQYLLRAITNLVTYDKTFTRETPRFLDWLNENRKDLDTSSVMVGIKSVQ